MGTSSQHLVFTLNGQHYAIAVSGVKKVIRAVELIPLPKGPDILMGLINMKGMIVPVVNIRKLFCLPDRELHFNDRIIICRLSSRRIAFIVEEAAGVLTFRTDQVEEAESIFPEVDYAIEGVAKFENNSYLIFDIDKLLSLKNRNRLDKAIEEQPKSDDI